MQAPSGILSFAQSLHFPGFERAFPGGFYPDDETSKAASSKSAPPPAPIQPNPRRLLVLDQGDGALPGPFAVAAAVNYLREDGRRDPLSTRFVSAALEQMGQESGVEDDDGLGRALFLLSQGGALGDDVWPAELADAPPDLASRSTLEERFRIDQVLQVRCDRAGVQAALAAKPALLVTARIHAGWSDPPGGVIAYHEKSEPLGVHAVCVLGCDDDGLVVQNSWGASWGKLPLGGEPRGGLARWSWDDFEANAIRAWQILLPPTEEYDPVVHPRAGYRSDEAVGRDRLGIEREVEALAMVVASRDVQPPLSIGLFGDWGVGKSFFMARLETAVDELAKSADEIERRLHAGERDGLAEPAYWSQIAHIRFNAWHFADANLWASLVVRIFDGLARHLAIKKDRLAQLDQEREELLRQLESERAEMSRLTEVRDTVEARIKKSERKLTAAEQEVREEQKRLVTLDLRSEAARVWNERVRSDPRLRAAVDELGLPAAVEGFAELQRGLQDVRGGAQRTMLRIGEVLGGGGRWRKFAIAAIVALGLALPVLVRLVLEDPATQAVLGFVTTAVTWVVGYAATVPRWLKRLEDSFQAVDAVLPRVKSAESPEAQARLEAQRKVVGDLRARRDEILAEVERRRELAEELEDRLREHRVGRELYRFVETKAEDADYQAKLGIVSAIREDLQLLSELLGRRGREKREAWDPRREPAEPTLGADVDRIVLYIDDLDRCAPERVVEILQAVHLLLAFPLFVVVVAVDSRWLLRSLRKEYADFLDVDEEDDERERVPPSTPQDYLEKIFQIALSIKPMSKDGYDALLDDLVPPPVVENGRVAPVHGGAVAARPEHLPHGEPMLALAPFVDLNPPSLDIPAREIEIMKGLDGFLATPRTVKRFVNTYRLLRASLEPWELDRFEDAASSDSEAVLLLLAILTGFPELAERVFRGLQGAPDLGGWRAFLEGLELTEVFQSEERLSHSGGPATSSNLRPGTGSLPGPPAGSRVQLERPVYFFNEVDDHIEVDEKDAWEGLRKLLDRFDFGSVDDLRPWIERVARYAIRPVTLDTPA